MVRGRFTTQKQLDWVEPLGGKTDSIHHHHHHHPEGVVYRSFCLNSSTVAVPEIVYRRWWCIESGFPLSVFYFPDTRMHTSVCEKKKSLRRRGPLGASAWEAQKQGLEGRFCRCFAGQKGSQTESCFFVRGRRPVSGPTADRPPTNIQNKHTHELNTK